MGRCPEPGRPPLLQARDTSKTNASSIASLFEFDSVRPPPRMVGRRGDAVGAAIEALPIVMRIHDCVRDRPWVLNDRRVAPVSIRPLNPPPWEDGFSPSDKAFRTAHPRKTASTQSSR
jgi:hypothetical protein